MADFDADRDEFERIMNDSKEGGPREAGRFVASSLAAGLELDAFKEIAEQGQMPDQVSQWLTQGELPKGAMKKIRNGFNSRVYELQDSLDRSRSWEGFGGLGDAERWLEIRKS